MLCGTAWSVSPIWSKVLGQIAEIQASHPVAVQREQGFSFAACVKKREDYATMFETVPAHIFTFCSQSSVEIVTSLQ